VSRHVSAHVLLRNTCKSAPAYTRLGLAFVLGFGLLALPEAAQHNENWPKHVTLLCSFVSDAMTVVWHWEFLPAFASELVPGVDLVPFRTFAVINVYWKRKQTAVTEDKRDQPQVIDGEYKPPDPMAGLR
jgi:hypothetical protein